MNEFSKFLRERSSLNFSRLHIPGHQGECEFLNCENFSKLDFTEIEGADYLYSSSGIIKALELRISRLYGCNSIVSTTGSTLSIQTIICAFKNKKFIAMKSSHVAFYNICIILGINPIFLNSYGEDLVFEIEKQLVKFKNCAALYITSPNYCGVKLDVLKISEICKKYGAILIVDNAHGAHLKFLEKDSHPMALGADICCDSFHKTLPALTGASVIHFKKGLISRSELKFNMSLFGTTSPSYIVMDSIGLCVDWLEKKGARSFLNLEQKVNDFKKKFRLKFLETDCSKISLECLNFNLSLEEIKDIFKNNAIEPEYIGKRYIVLVLSPFLKEISFVRLEKSLKELEAHVKVELTNNYCNRKPINMVLGLREAVFGGWEKINVKNSLGKICARGVLGDVPGTFEIIAGEEITKNKINWLIKNGVEEIYVVKN